MDKFHFNSGITAGILTITGVDNLQKKIFKQILQVLIDHYGVKGPVLS